MQRWETVGEVVSGRSRFEWRVDERYFQHPLSSSSICSPTFEFCNSLWYITKRPYGWAGPLVDSWICLGFCGTSSQGPTLNVTLGIRKANGVRLKSCTGETSHYGSFEDTKFLRTSLVQRRQSEIAAGGRVTVYAEVWPEDVWELGEEAVPGGQPPVVTESSENPKQVDDLPLNEGKEEEEKVDQDVIAKTLKTESLDRLLQDLKGLWSSEEDCDISFRVQGTDDVISAHKPILRARCPVFDSMFRHNMAEQTSGVVEIDDCDPETFRDLLQYIYTGSVESMSPENAFSLFEAADKYCLDELRNECLQFVRAGLCVDTFCDALVLSLRYSEEELLEQAAKYFAEHMNDIIVTDRWLTFLHENTAEGNKLFIKALVPESNEQ